MQGLYFVGSILAAPAMIALITCGLIFASALNDVVMETLPVWLLLPGWVYVVVLGSCSAEVARMADVLETIDSAEAQITGKTTTEQIMRTTAVIRALYHAAHWLPGGDAEQAAVVFF